MIAHDRTIWMYENDINFIDMIEMGAYIQLNADSVIGKEDLPKDFAKNF